MRWPFVRRSTYDALGHAYDSAYKRWVAQSNENARMREMRAGDLEAARNTIAGLQDKFDDLQSSIDAQMAIGMYHSIVRKTKDGRYRVGIVDWKTKRGMWNQTGRGTRDYGVACKLAATLPMVRGQDDDGQG